MIRHLRTDQLGISMVELVVAMMVMFVAIFTLVGAMGLGIRLVGSSKQRQSAVASAQSEIEEIRRLSYTAVALPAYPVHATDPDDPDSGVSGIYYNVAADGTTCTAPSASCEEIVQDASGLVTHTAAETIGSTQLTKYVFVTWVDDTAIAGDKDYKRVVIFSKWSGAAVGGIANFVRLQTFVGSGSIVLPTLTPGPSATAGPTATPSPTVTPTPGSCPGDAVAPTGSLSLLSGAGAVTGFTNSTQVTAALNATDGCSPLAGQLSQDGTAFGSDIVLASGVTTQTSYTIPGGNGTKTVHARYKDGVANTSSNVSASITLDQTLPTAPSSLGLSGSGCNISGANRVANFTWTAGTDTNLLGHRLYRSYDSGTTYTLATAVSSTTASDTSTASSAVEYVVRAYDKAGNESVNSNVLKFKKDKCT